MKKTILTLVFGLSLVAGSVFALPVTEGDYVNYIGGDSSYQGHYLWKNQSQEKLAFSTFCLEYNEHMTTGVSYYVNNVSDVAYNGGVGSEGDPISLETKWLFSEFLNGDLDTYKTSSGILSLQKAFWFLEDEIESVSGLSEDFVDLATVAAQQIRASQLSYTFGDLSVMNITYGEGTLGQSQLVGTAPVPEPATLILFGSGLAGLAFYRRKKK